MTGTRRKLDSRVRRSTGSYLAGLAGNIAVKLPLTWDGLKACRTLTGEGTMVNVTLCFSANQALLAAKAGATFISPFVGRLDDISLDGMELIADIRTIYGHLSKVLVKAGDKVERGAVIGLSGNTGRSTGPHLHYEILVQGRSVNPRAYLWD